MENCSADLIDDAETFYESALKPGSRFQLSRLGMERCPKLGLRTGTVIGLARNASGFRVQFDGAKTAQSLHRNYIIPIDPGELG